MGKAGGIGLWTDPQRRPFNYWFCVAHTPTWKPAIRIADADMEKEASFLPLLFNLSLVYR